MTSMPSQRPPMAEERRDVPLWVAVLLLVLLLAFQLGLVISTW